MSLLFSFTAKSERSEPINAYHLVIPLFSSFTGSVVCHILPLFGKSPLSIISFWLYDSFTCALPLLSFSGLFCFYTDPLHNQPSLESTMSCTPVLATIRGCCTNFIVFLYKAWWKCTPIYIYIYIYVETLSQNRTVVIKISCWQLFTPWNEEHLANQDKIHT